MKKLYLLMGLALLTFCAGCGSSGSGIVTGFIPTGGFSNASLSGQYVYQIQGVDFSVNASGAAYREAGVFTANGAGLITSVADDFSEAGSVGSTTSTGAYVIRTDGTGSLTFTNALGTVNFEVTLVSASKVYLMEIDSPLNAGGLAELQNAAAIAAAPSGTFVFREHDLNTLQSVGSVGAFAISGGAVSAGSEDVNRAGVLTSLTFTGSFNPPNTANGRGTATFTDSSPATYNFFYYIVDANNIRFLEATPGITGVGRAELQNGTPALSGSYAFGSGGDTLTSVIGVNMAGRFTASGGTISAGARDSVQDGASVANISFTGTYTQAASGRALLNLSNAANNIFVVWMVSPSRGFFVVNDPNTIQEGTLDLQQSGTFTNSTTNGQYALIMDGVDTGGLKDRVGTLLWDGSGKLTLNEVSNAAGVINGPVVLSGTYAVSGNGRTTGSISSISSNLVFYLVSSTDAYVIQNDTNVEVNGTISKQ